MVSWSAMVSGGHDAHRLGRVRQHQLAGDVADGVDAVDVGTATLVDGDGAAIGLDPRLVESVALEARGEPDRLEHLVGLDDLFLAVLADGDLDLVARVLDLLDLGLQQHLHAEVLVVLGQLLGDLGVLGRHHPVEELHDGDVDAEVGHHVGELDADGARARDHDRAGQLVVEDLLLVGDHVLRELGAGHEPGGGAGGDDDVVAGDLAGLPVVALDLDGLGVDEGAPAVDLLDLVLLHQEVHALDDRVRDLAAARVGRLEVHRGVAGDPELVLLVGQDVRQLGVAQQCLRRDAPDVEADTSPVLLLDHTHLQAELGGADGGDVPTGAGTEDQDIEIAHGGEPIPRP